MLKYPAALSIWLFLLSCTTKPKTEPLDQWVTQTLELGNTPVQLSTAFQYRELEKKYNEWATRDCSQNWFSKASRIREMVSRLNDYLMTCRKAEKIPKAGMDSIRQRLLTFRDSIVSIDSAFLLEFGESLDPSHSSRNAYDDAPAAELVFSECRSLDHYKLLINCLITRTAIVENKLTAYCNLKCSNGIFFFDVYRPLIGQNKSHLEPGDLLEIQAGIGAFSRAATPEIRINGKKVKIDEEGVANYSLRTCSRPGNYSLPVSITYFNQITGNDEVFYKQIEYTVDAPCKGKK